MLASRPAMQDVVCLSHRPWTHVLEHPHQVMRRFARTRRVFFVEERRLAGAGSARTALRSVSRNVTVVSIQLPRSAATFLVDAERRAALAALVRTERIRGPLVWITSPMAAPGARVLDPELVVYDCTEDLASHPRCEPELRARETELLARADVVFTAGDALFEAKRGLNVSTYPLPNSVDREHFAPARGRLEAPADQALVPGPRIGVLGVLDERLDLTLLDQVARALRHAQLVIVGSLSGITRADLPRRPNLHYLGPRRYRDLPAYLAGWSAALLPYVIDDATRCLDPPSALACLAAGVPVVSTPLPEVATRLGARGAVHVAAPRDVPAALDVAIASERALPRAAEAILAQTSWDRTCAAMDRLVAEAALARGLARGRERTSPLAP